MMTAPIHHNPYISPPDPKAVSEPEPGAMDVPVSGKTANHRLLGLPLYHPQKWPSVLIKNFQKGLDERRSFSVLLDTCLRCGLCAHVCPVYQASGRPEDTPAARIELAGYVYRRSFGLAHRLFGRLEPVSMSPDDEILKEWYISFHRCLICRRCQTVCPLGLDPSEAAMTARHILAAAGLTADSVSGRAASAVSADDPAWSPQAWLRACNFLEKLVFRHTGMAVRFPVDQSGADVLLIPSGDDPFFHIGTMIGYAVAFHMAGISWTTHSYGPAAENFGLFLGERQMRLIFRRIVESARHLKPKTIIWGESGHGWRVARALGCMLHNIDALEFHRPVHIIDYTCNLLDKGAFDHRLRREANTGLKITYHDPCHLSRWSGMRSAPRRLLRAAVPRVIEMDPHTIMENTSCCGGGAGLLYSDAREFRLAAGEARAGAFQRTEANALTTACSECKFALAEVLAHYIGREPRVFGVMEIFGRALLPYLAEIGIGANPYIQSAFLDRSRE